MIVIADDISGAAEIAGIGHRYGLRTRLRRLTDNSETPDISRSPDVDLIVVDTDSRSGPVEQATARLERLDAAELRQHDRALYKKTDSILRGHVHAEMRALLGLSGRSAGLLVAQNPSLGRVIRHGRYLVDGTPLHETSLADDPQWPIRSSDPVALVDTGEPVPVRLAAVGQEVVAGVLTIGQAADAEDMLSWARQLTPEVLPAGSGDLFEAILEVGGAVASEQARAKALAVWRSRMRTHWSNMRIESVDSNVNQALAVNDNLEVVARVRLGELKPEEVQVQLYHGALVSGEKLANGTTAVMSPEGTPEDGVTTYRCAVECRHSGRRGFAVRVLPHHADVVHPFDPGMIHWG